MTWKTDSRSPRADSRRRLRVAVAVLVLAAVAAGAWYAMSRPGSPAVRPGAPASDIAASGFIEADEVSISSEVGGRIVFIGVDEGDVVQAGVPLVRLDDTLLKAQLRQAQAAVELAQAGIKQAMVSRDGARKAWEDSLDVQANPLELKARIAAAQGAFDLADLNLWIAKNQPLPDQSIWLATVNRDSAKRTLDSLLEIEARPQEINALVSKAQAAYDAAAAALETSEKQVEHTKAALGVVEAQIGKLTLMSPIPGVVAARLGAVGETAQPGMAILTVADLREVVLTVYVAEGKLGLVKVGQAVAVSVDSYPGERFRGKVVFISARGLFTPRNIQLKEEREKVVFPVKIRVPNPERKLKAGMPADAVITTGG